MLEIEGLTKRFGDRDVVTAVDALNLDIERGELLVLLGPSGCGKSTVLHCLAGLETPDGGRIVMGERTVFDWFQRLNVPPERRDLGMVFQSYALWPHKTVRENIAYPLRARKMKHGLAGGWVEQIASLVDCEALLDRHPAQLSGGQQQRVALARGLVARPEVMLFDEPLSNLDALLRAQVRNDLHKLHSDLGFTGVYVTHDQAEAFALGSRLAIMSAGRIDQVGTPQEVFEFPATSYAANFVGLSNYVSYSRDLDGWRTSLSATPLQHPSLESSDVDVELRFRPTDGRFTTDTDTATDRIVFQAEVRDIVYCGAHYEIAVRANDSPMMIHVPSADPRPSHSGQRVRIAVPFDRCRWYGGSGQLLGR